MNQELSPYLSIPAMHQHRLELLKLEIERWTGPLNPEDRYEKETLSALEERLGHNLPIVFFEFYRIAGKASSIWNQQDHLLSPTELLIKDDKLVFIQENQGVVWWYISVEEFASNDPPVYLGGDHESIEAEELSMFLLAWFLYCLKWNPKTKHIIGHCSKELVKQLRQSFPQLPLTIEGLTSSSFYGYRDIVVEIDSADYASISCRGLSDFDEVLTYMRDYECDIVYAS